MSAKAAAWVLFVALLLVWPLPLLGLEGSFIPVARFLELALALSGLAIVEGTGGMVGLFLLLLWGHVLVYGGLLYVFVYLLRRLAFGRVSDASRALIVALAIAGLLAWSMLASPYDTQFHHSSAHASLLEIYR